MYMCILGPTEIQQINGATGGSQKIEKDLVGQIIIANYFSKWNLSLAELKLNTHTT